MDNAIAARGWSARWSKFSERVLAECANPNCRHTRERWRRLFHRGGLRLQENWCCTPACFETVLARTYRTLLKAPARLPGAVPHRVPLGLVLLSKGCVSNPQLRTALRAQQTAGRGRIGEWLVEMGVINEREVVVALGQQWGCAVYPAGNATDVQWSRMLPLCLQEHFRMMPVSYIRATGVLLIAFSEGVDHTLLYRIEQMLDCGAEPCLLSPSAMGRLLEQAQQQGRSDEIVFDRIADPAEMARITRSYVTKLSACNVRSARCGEYVWARLECAREPMNLMFHGSPAAWSLNYEEAISNTPTVISAKALPYSCR